MVESTPGRYATTSYSTLRLLELQNWVEPFPRHWHDEWGIAVIEQGVNRFWYRGGWHDAPAGTIIVVPPGEIHDGGLAPDPWAERMSYVPVDTMEMIAQACSERRQPLMFASPIIRDESLAAELRALHRGLSTPDSFKPDEGGELQVRVIGTLLERYGSVRVDVPRSDESVAIRRAKQFMGERASTRIMLPEVADAVGLSLYHFIREFHKRVGMTPHAYLKQLRIMIAQRLLCSDDPISEVALEAGFADQSHLTREFHRTIGVTPGAFRAAWPVQRSTFER